MNDIQMHQKELETKLWAMANNLRGTMEAYEFKNYILGMIFYYYLSKREEDYMVNLLKDDGLTFEEAWGNEEYKEAVVEEALRDLGYLIEPQYLFHNMVRMVENNNFDIEFLQAAINSIMESTMGADSQEDFENLFDDMQLDSTKLGRTVKDRSAVMGRIIATLADIGIDMEDTKIDVLGNAYEYLIGQFAATAGKKAGEFYTPAGPAELLCRLACDGLTDVKEACDPTCGSGSLLLRLQNYANVRMFYGQELTAQTYNLARMNMILRGVPYRNFQIFNGDTLVNDNFEGHKFRVQVANPPYSAKLANPTAMADDPRYNEYGKLVPASKADFAFVQHMVYHMDDDGRIAVLLPLGILFRSGAEETIRRYLIERLNVIDAVIGLAPNLFFGTSIPVCVLVLKKNRNGNTNNILFVDATEEFKAGKAQNTLLPEHIDRIVSAYKERKDIPDFSKVVTLDELKENNWNLNIARYVCRDDGDDQVDVMKAVGTLSSMISRLQSYQEALLSNKGSFGELEESGTMTIEDMFDSISDKGHPEEVVLTIIQGQGTLPRNDAGRRIEYDEKQISTYKKVLENDFIMHLRSFEGGLEMATCQGIVSPAYTILRAKVDIVPEFYKAYFRSDAFIKGKLRRITEGIRDGKSINMKDFWKLSIPYPSLEKQKEIADTVSALNGQIDAEEAVLEQWKIVRKGVMQQLFRGDES